MRFITAFFSIVTAARACIVLDGDRISAKHLAQADPIFASLNPDLPVAYAPLAGVRRVMPAQELASIARANHLAPAHAFKEACFERETRTLTAVDLLPVLHSALAIEGAAIEILDFTRTGVPRGALEFSRAGLSSSGMWRGHVRYDGNHSAPIWVKVRIVTQQTWIEAAQPLAPGKPIEASGLVARAGPRSPLSPAPIASVDQAAGRIPLRAIKPGEPIFASMLAIPHDVERGEKVQVQVASGGAHLSFEAVAESSGRDGESVLVKNPENGRYFQARVESKGKVSVIK